MGEGAQAGAEIAGLLTRHGVSPNKVLGQHFLVDANIVRKIVRTARLDGATPILEVGAGTGTLTRALAATGAPVRAYEVDEALRPVLAEALAGLDNVDLRFEDAMAADLPTTLEGPEWVMVANLPYNVGTPLLLDLVITAPQVRRFVVMVQDEVAARLCASPGSRIYGIPSVTLGLFSTARIRFRVGAQVFHPPPRVRSAVIEIERKRKVEPEAKDAVAVARAAFSQRRKMLRSSLRGLITDLDATLERAGVDPMARPESLSPGSFVDIAKARRDEG